jgi:hypothetical protein
MSANYLKKYGLSKPKRNKKMRSKRRDKRSIKKIKRIRKKIKMTKKTKIKRRKRFLLTTGSDLLITSLTPSENWKTRISPPRSSWLFLKKPNTQETTL